MSIPNVLLSYSWDNDYHKAWVVNLMNRLRDEGINAEIDRTITQQGTINLNRMMVEKIRDNDFVVVVLTENYKDRAEKYQGGVGLETSLLQNEIQTNPQKIIPIKRSAADDEFVIPYYLKGLNYTDFSIDDKFEESLLELLHRIKKVDLIEVNPIGVGRKLKPQKVEYTNDTIQNSGLNDSLKDLIPDLTGISDLDKKKFIIGAFNRIKEMLIELCEETKFKNRNFDYELDELSKDEFKISFYLNGMNKRNVRVWYGSMFGSRENSIFISYDNYTNSRNSFNDMINCEVEGNKLNLKTMMNFSDTESGVDGVVKCIWKNICLYLR